MRGRLCERHDCYGRCHGLTELSSMALLVRRRRRKIDVLLSIAIMAIGTMLFLRYLFRGLRTEIMNTIDDKQNRVSFFFQYW